MSERKTLLFFCNTGLTKVFVKNLTTTDYNINHYVKNYDFYNPKNIFVTDFSDFDNLREWLDGEFEEIPNEVLIKYSFQN